MSKREAVKRPTSRKKASAPKPGAPSTNKLGIAAALAPPTDLGTAGDLWSDDPLDLDHGKRNGHRATLATPRPFTSRRVAPGGSDVHLLRPNRARVVIPTLAQQAGWVAGGTLVYRLEPGSRYVEVYCPQEPVEGLRGDDITSRLDASFRTSLPRAARACLGVSANEPVLAFCRGTGKNGAPGPVVLLGAYAADPLLNSGWEMLSWPHVGR